MKQAFLITAYNHFDHLDRLIRFLDDVDVWFYVYVDAKIDIPDFLAFVKTANPVEVLHSQRVEWGDQSQIITELELFAKAYETREIEWFHLISGTDFPLRPAKDILQFYEEAEDVDCFMETEPIPPHLADRVEIYHLGVRRPSELGGLTPMIQSKFRALQVKIGIKRKSPVEGGFRYGSNWVDLRRNAVKMLLDERDAILSSTKYTQIANEIYKQTFLQNRGLRIVNDNLRYIDWSARQPSPKSLGLEDYEAMMNSGKLFARKFDAEDSPILCDKILATLV
ncbi:MAG: beta-1,6-N-acetylglucosaminyltransferase [Muribaculaceae bacterium]|nr:beta-1,6-N-acetylglucosaminyltransferase [Muribaculaceae bacterium]